MIKTKWILLVILVLSPIYAQAAKGLLSFGGENIIKLVEIPDEAAYKMDSGEYIDIGYIYKNVSILFIPIWNYDGRLVGYINDQGSYLELTAQEVNVLAESAGVVIPDRPYLDEWNRFGGKLVFLFALIAIGMHFLRKSKKTTDYRSNSPTVHERLVDLLSEGLEFNDIEYTDEAYSGFDYSGQKIQVASLISVYVVVADDLSLEELKRIVDRYFEFVLPLRKILAPSSLNSIAYPLFVFYKSPNPKLRRGLMAHKKKKMMKKTHCLPVVLDVESDIIYGRMSMYPPKRVLRSCFIQTEVVAENI